MSNKNKQSLLSIYALAGILAAAPAGLRAQPELRDGGPLFLTATNGSTNYLAVVDAGNRNVSYIPTGGSGGASGNAGGVAVQGRIAAIVNFGSSNVTVFRRQGNSLQPVEMIPTASQPVSVSFGNGHLVVLGRTSLESFPVLGGMVAKTPDGSVSLLAGDGTAGQVVTFDGGAIYSETSGQIGMVSFGVPGLVGPSVPVALPAAPNNDTPLGMVARGANVYVTIAHSDLEALIVNGKIISTAVGPTPFHDASGKLTHAPCWNALYGQFLYSSDSPGKQLLRYLVSDNNVFFDKASVASLSGPPTDLDIQGSLLGVIDGGDGTNSNVSVFDINPEGELSLRFTVKVASGLNGAAFLQ